MHIPASLLDIGLLVLLVDSWHQRERVGALEAKVEDLESRLDD